MDSGRLIFDSPSSSSSSRGRLLLLGGGNPMFRGVRSVVMGVAEEGGAASKKRPFFTSPDEIFEEEYHEEQLSEKKRRLTPEQVNLLERSFKEEKKLEPERKSELARRLGLQPKQVTVWFQNRRARWKNKQLELDFDRLKSSYDALLLDHDALLNDNHRLRSQVNSLMEKLQVQANEEQGARAGRVTGLTPAAYCADVAAALNCRQIKAEDEMLSTGFGGSTAVAEVDEDVVQHHLQVESSWENIYVVPESFQCCMGWPVIHSEEDEMIER